MKVKDRFVYINFSHLCSVLWAKTRHSHAWVCCKNSSLRGSLLVSSSRGTNEDDSETDYEDEEEALLYKKGIIKSDSYSDCINGHYSVNY